MINKKIRRFFKRLLRRFEPAKWLFLDDLRHPPLHLNRMFDVVRSYDDFVEYIETYGVPELISMDHDLDREHTLFFYDNGGFRNPPDPKFENFKLDTTIKINELSIKYGYTIKIKSDNFKEIGEFINKSII